MEYLSELTVVAATVVLFVTEAIKHVPVYWTSKYAVWVNILLSFIGSVVVYGMPTFTNWLDFITQWLVIAVIAALAYNQIVKPAVTKA